MRQEDQEFTNITSSRLHETLSGKHNQSTKLKSERKKVQITPKDHMPVGSPFLVTSPVEGVGLIAGVLLFWLQAEMPNALVLVSLLLCWC